MDRGFYPYGWFPHVGLDEGADYMQMQQGAGMADPMMDFMDFGAEYGDPMAGQGMYLDNSMLAQGAQHPMAAHAFCYGQNEWMDPRTDAWLEERGAPLQYGGAFDDSRLYEGDMQDGYSTSWWDANPDLIRDGGMASRPLSHNHPRWPDQPLYANASLRGHREDAALARGIIGGRREPGVEYAQTIRDNSGRTFMMGPYAPGSAHRLNDFPGSYTREDFMEERLPMDTAWQRNMRLQTPLTMDDRRYIHTGPVYRQPSILDDYQRRVHFG